ncbi:neprilysin-2-like [Cotesia glomerata]|uniref:Uncharacterized protein n=1 Tax=Cotesia glomerata TaxID=32391 RepID=A0AAV7IIE4_COTGL|nr:neprilysin-2-like [Cotesia glomerata]KAH0552798.1 hypothetical protein KQX54_015434 [Cotesia glomerata]
MKPQKSSAVYLITAFVFAGLVVPNHGAALNSPAKPGEHKCTSDKCIVERLDTATHVMKFRNSDVNPCDNMFRFVCGNYDGTDISHTPSAEIEMRNAIMDSFIGVVDALTSDFRPFKMIEELHDICTDDNARNQDSVNLLKGIIMYMKGWPMMDGDKWKEDDFDWMNFSGESKKSGYPINYFVDFEPLLDVEEDGEKIMVFKAHPSPQYFEYTAAMMKKPEAYKDYMMTIAKLMGATGDISKDVEDVMEFEKKLHAIDADHDDKTDHVMRIDELQKEFPGIDWSMWASKTLIPFMDKDEEPLITIWNAEAMKEFFKLMAETPKRVQANYAVWRMVQKTVSYLTPEFRKEQEKFWKTIGHEEVSEESFCDDIAKFYMEEAMKYFFIDQFKNSAESMQNMVQDMKDSMVAMMKDCKHLDTEDKEKGSKIVSEMPVTLGTSTRFSDPKELEALYAESEFHKNNFLQTLLNLNMFRIEIDYSKKLQKDLNFVNDQPEGLETPRNIHDHLFIPPEILDSPMFDNNRPMYMNYGAAGPNIARELFVSVYQHTKLKDEDKQSTLMEPMKCFQNMFSNFTNTDAKEDIALGTMSTMMGQFIGLRSAYKAYKDYEAKNGPEAPLPEVSHTPEQLFWMAYVGQFCKANVDVEKEDDIEGIEMKMMEFIMQKMLAQIPEVAQDFSCPAGSKLNPETKCEWW